MSLETRIEELAVQISKLTALIAEGNELSRQVIALYPRTGVNDEQVCAGETGKGEAPAATETAVKNTSAAGKKTASKKTAPVTQPPVDASTDDENQMHLPGLGDDGFDDGFGDQPSAVEKNYSAEDAKNAMKAIRDGLRVTKGFSQDQALTVAKTTLKEAGFSNINDITDDAANATVARCREAVRAISEEALANFITKAAQFGTTIA